MISLRDALMVTPAVCVDEQWDTPLGWVRRVWVTRAHLVRVEFDLIGSQDVAVRFVASAETVESALAIAASAAGVPSEAALRRVMPREHDRELAVHDGAVRIMTDYLSAGRGPRSPFELGSSGWEKYLP